MRIVEREKIEGFVRIEIIGMGEWGGSNGYKRLECIM